MPSLALQNRIAQFNPWLLAPGEALSQVHRYLPERYIPRHVQSVPLHPGRALLITGPRQAGKTTLAWRLLLDVIPDILFLNMEDSLLRNGFPSPLDLVDFLRHDWPAVRAIFIDEIQHLPEAGLFLKGMVDAKLGIPILATGSSAFDLRDRTRETLAGRTTRCFLGPLSLCELLAAESLDSPLARSLASRKLFAGQLTFGGYPAVCLAAKPEEKITILSDLVEALILRDASDIFRIQRVDAFRRLLVLLAGQVGSLVNYSELAALCSVDVGTIISYVEIMEESHILNKVTPYAEGKRREITGTPKIFFLDNGIRNQLLFNFQSETDLRPDRGALLENWVFSEIRKILPIQDSLRFWRSKSQAEMDFVIVHGSEVFAIEAKHTLPASPRLSRSAISFIEAYKPTRLIVVNTSQDTQGETRTTPVQYMTPAAFCSWLENKFGRGEQAEGRRQ
jgi:uncharacterized protein